MKHPFWTRDDLALNAFVPALEAVQAALEPRRYVADPAADADVTQFQLTTRGAADRDDGARAPDAGEFFAAEQCPSDATFR
jgi:hypothetical protein